MEVRVEEMTIPVEVFGTVVEQIRFWRQGGERMSTIVNRLLPLTERLDIQSHLRAAFCTDSLPHIERLPRDEQGKLRPETLDNIFEPRVEATRTLWENAPPYPDIYRRRDRHAFRAVAEKYRARILVAATDLRISRLIGRIGYRPCPAGLWGRPRAIAPNVGLLAADRDDKKFLAMLDQAGFTYEDYVNELKRIGFRVSSHDSGYLIRDEANNTFYPGYYLQGIYTRDGVHLWKGREGEIIRSELNRRMGEHLVQYGPHDLWEPRRAAANNFGDPLLPVLIFEADGNVDVRQTYDELRSYYLYHRLPWEQLYGE